MKIITFCNLKGGTGKTSSCLAIAQAGARDGRRVLIVDTDPQGNAAQWSGASTSAPGTFELLAGKAKLRSVIQHTDQGLDVIAGGPDLMTIHTSQGSARRLADKLQGARRVYDIVCIDSGPTLGELTFEAIYAADLIMVCAHAAAGSLSALASVAELAEGMGKAGKIRTVICQYDGRASVRKFQRAEIEREAAELGAPVIGVIRQGVAVEEAHTNRQPLYMAWARSNPARDYLALYELIKD